ncbi:MAG: MlaD family protein [Leptospirillum sp.]|jgi:phospholipid/cholesterol/gamma-HCH transport system substrate-binding protein|nr:MlaD family protein [Nitrospiraceae bacterium]
MKLHYVHRENEKRLERLAAFFLLIPLLGFFFGLYEVAVNQHAFDKRYKIYTILDQSFGIVPGVPVKLAGIAIGEVKSVDFTKLNQIRVEMEVLRKYEPKIRQDSFITVEKSGIISGDVTLRISLGSPWLPVILPGHRIKGEAPLTLDQIMAKLNPTILNLQRIVANIADLSDSVDRGKGTVGAILKRQEIYDELRDTAGNIRQTTEKVRDSVDRLPAIMKNVDQSIKDVKAATPKLAPISKSALSLVVDTKKTISNADEILESLQQSWPLRDLIQIPEATLPLGQSTRDSLPYPQSGAGGNKKP